MLQGWESAKQTQLFLREEEDPQLQEGAPPGPPAHTGTQLSKYQHAFWAHLALLKPYPCVFRLGHERISRTPEMLVGNLEFPERPGSWDHKPAAGTQALCEPQRHLCKSGLQGLLGNS